MTAQFMTTETYEIEFEMAELRAELYLSDKPEHTIFYYSTTYANRLNEMRARVAATLETERVNDELAAEIARMESPEFARETIKRAVAEWVAKNAGSYLFLLSIVSVIAFAAARAIVVITH